MRLRLIVAGIVVAIILAFGIRECRNRQIVTSEINQANPHAIQAHDHATQGASHDQIVLSLQSRLDSANADVARLRAKLAKLQASAGSVPPAGNPHLGTVGTHADPGTDGGCTSLQARYDVQSELVKAQDARYEALEAQTGELTASRDSWRSAAGERAQEVEHLRKALAHVPEFRPWAAGIEYGTDRSAGVWAEYDFGPVRVGLDVVRRPLDIAGRTNLEGVARIGWRF